jgi:hypothetical protein
MAAAVAQPEASFMIAGTAAFVTSTRALLQGNGVQSTHVKDDAFVGWSGPRSVSGSEIGHPKAVNPTGQ